MHLKQMRFPAAAVLAGLLLALASGCAYTNIQIPMSSHYNRTEVGEKSGEASNHIVLWLVAWGDAGTHTAAQNGRLTTIYHADRKIFSLLFGTYTRTTTVVYGE